MSISRPILPVVLLVGLLAVGCGDHSETCEAWANASCPADYPDLVQGVTDDACLSNFDFSCGEDCDEEYLAKIQCETQNPNCCNEVECNNASLTACGDVSTAWSDCTERVRDACEE